MASSWILFETPTVLAGIQVGSGQSFILLLCNIRITMSCGRFLPVCGKFYIIHIYHAPARAVFVPIEGSCVSFWWVAPLLRRLAHELYLVFSWQTQCWVDHGLTFNVFILFLGNYIICAGTATEKLYRLGELLHYLGFLILNRISEGTQCLGLHWSPVGLSCLCICQVVTFRRCDDTSAMKVSFDPQMY